MRYRDGMLTEPLRPRDTSCVKERHRRGRHYRARDLRRCLGRCSCSRHGRAALNIAFADPDAPSYRWQPSGARATPGYTIRREVTVIAVHGRSPSRVPSASERR